MIEPTPQASPGEAEVGRDRKGDMIEPTPQASPGEAEVGRDREGDMIEPTPGGRRLARPKSAETARET